MQQQVISVSRRTDIPAFYTEWFMNRVRAGYCTVQNPYNAHQITRVSLKSKDVICFVFWTRNPKPLIGHLRELSEKGYHYYFLYTITGYPEELEMHTPSRDEAIETFTSLSDFIGKDKVIWRYDPVILSTASDEAWHKKNFSYIAKQLAGKTEKVILSIIDPYQKTQLRLEKETEESFSLFDEAFEVSAYEKVLKHFIKVSEKYAIQIQACAEENDIHLVGVPHGKCIDDELIQRLTGLSVSPRKDSNQRKLCKCVRAKDIGMNNSCLFGCKYCYATNSLAKAQSNFAQHDPQSASLIGDHDSVKAEGDAAEAQGDLFN